MRSKARKMSRRISRTGTSRAEHRLLQVPEAVRRHQRNQHLRAVVTSVHQEAGPDQGKHRSADGSCSAHTPSLLGQGNSLANPRPFCSHQKEFIFKGIALSPGEKNQVNGCAVSTDCTKVQMPCNPGRVAPSEPRLDTTVRGTSHGGIISLPHRAPWPPDGTSGGLGEPRSPTLKRCSSPLPT